MNSIFIHFNVTAALFFFRDSNKGLFVDNCFMMIGKQIPCSLLALRRVAHKNCGCSRTTAIFFIAEKRIDRSSTPFRLSCWRRYGTRFEFVDNTDNTIQDPFSWLQNSRRMRKPNCFLCARIMRYGALSIAHLTGSGPFKLLCSNATSLSCSDRLSTDELRQGYNFLCPCAVYPKGRKSSRKTCYFHTLGIMVIPLTNSVTYVKMYINLLVKRWWESGVPDVA